MSPEHGLRRRGQCKSLTDLFTHSILYEVDRDLSNRVIFRAQKHRTVIEISSDDDDSGEATPAARNRGRWAKKIRRARGDV